MTDRTPTTTMGVVTYINGSDPKIVGLTWGGQVFEGYDIYELGVTVGDTVLTDYCPASRQWIVVAIIV